MKSIKKSFTLVELLVVVTILAILAGGAIAVFDGVGRRAAKGQAINDMSQLTRIIKNFQATQRTLPSNFDSLLKVDKLVVATINGDYAPDPSVLRSSVFGGATLSNSRNIHEIPKAELKLLDFVSWLHPELTGTATSPPKLLRVLHPFTTLNSLVNAGITELRFVDTLGDHETATIGTITAMFITGIAGTTGLKIGRSLDVINPSQVFEQPIAESDPTIAIDYLNLGRGFTFPIAQDLVNNNVSIISDLSGAGAINGGAMVLATWNPGPLGSANSLVGAAANDLLVAFGIGNNSTLINSDIVSRDVNESTTSVGLGEAPSYGAPERATYSRYIALFKVGSFVTGSGEATIDLLADGVTGAAANVADSGIPDVDGIFSGGGLGSTKTAPLTIYDPTTSGGGTAGVLALERAVFIAIVDCFGNSGQSLTNQFNKK